MRLWCAVKRKRKAGPPAILTMITAVLAVMVGTSNGLTIRPSLVMTTRCIKAATWESRTGVYSSTIPILSNNPPFNPVNQRTEEAK